MKQLNPSEATPAKSRMSSPNEKPKKIQKLRVVGGGAEAVNNPSPLLPIPPENDIIENPLKRFSISNTKEAQIITNMATPTPAITLVKETRTHFVATMVFRERVCRRFIGCLIKSGKVSDIPYNTKDPYYSKARLGSQKITSALQHLKAYYSLINRKTGEVEVRYKRTQKHSWGRAYPVGLMSLCGLPRDVRNAIVADTYYDFDLSSAHPSIVWNICSAHGIPCPFITKWLKGKEKIRAEFYKAFSLDPTAEDSVKCVKDLINSTLYGGGGDNVERWREEWKLPSEAVMPSFHKSIMWELKAINKELIAKNKDLYEFCRHLKSEKSEPKDGSFDLCFLSYYAQEQELRIVGGMLEKLARETKCLTWGDANYYGQYEYDGFKLLKECVIAHFGNVEACIKYLNEETLKLTGMKMDWEEKKIKTTIDITKELEGYEEFQEEEMTEIIQKYYEEITCPMGISSDAGMARYINRDLYPKEFVFKNGVWFCWGRKETRWRKHTSEEPPVALCNIIKEEIPKNLLERFDDIKEEIGEEVLSEDLGKKYELLKDECRQLVKLLGTSAKLGSVLISCKSEMFAEIKFDEDGWLLGFTNGLIDLRTRTFRPYEMGDYLTMNCGYAWNDENWQHYQKCNEPPFEICGVDTECKICSTRIQLGVLWREILPCDLVRDLVKVIFATGLLGKCIEKFFIFNGGGRNGKGLLDELHTFCLNSGEDGYGYGNMPVSIYTEPMKGNTPNPELANINKKRWCVASEPKKGKKIDNAQMKAITGGQGISGRKLYSNETNILNHGTFPMECNYKPPFAEEISSADTERLLDIMFPNRFTDKEAEINGVNVFRQNPRYKELDWRIEVREVHMFMMLEAFGWWQRKQMNINSFVPASVVADTKAYLRASVSINKFMEENFEKVPRVDVADKMRTPCISIKQIIEVITESKDFRNLPKKEQSADWIKDKNVKQFFKTDDLFREDYAEDFSYLYDVEETVFQNGQHQTITKTKKTHKDVLLWWRAKTEEEDEVEQVD